VVGLDRAGVEDHAVHVEGVDLVRADVRAECGCCGKRPKRCHRVRGIGRYDAVSSGPHA
jgi:hypothetical protein